MLTAVAVTVETTCCTLVLVQLRSALVDKPLSSSLMSHEEMVRYIRDTDLSVLIRHGEPVEFGPLAERGLVAIRTVTMPASDYERLTQIADREGMEPVALIERIICQWVSAHPA